MLLSSLYEEENKYLSLYLYLYIIPHAAGDIFFCSSLREGGGGEEGEEQIKIFITDGELSTQIFIHTGIIPVQ